MTMTRLSKHSIVAALFWTSLSGIDAFAPSRTRHSTYRRVRTHMHFNDKNLDTESDNPVEEKKTIWLSCEDIDDNDLPLATEKGMLRKQEEMNRFAQGKELEGLRSDTEQLKQNLKWALHTDDLTRIISLKEAIAKAENRDPEFVYTRSLKKIARAGRYPVRKKYGMLKKYTKEALVARQCIPRLNFEGLWVGNFGQGSELVNVTYTGDTMTAYKTSGKETERGEIVFRADLSPSVEKKPLTPINLQGSAAGKWGTKQLERYTGEGHDPKAKSANDDGFVDGNLIMFDGYFSFLWVPTRKHVFFSRPKPELILHMMRDTISLNDEMENMRDHLSRCYDKAIEEAFAFPAKVDSTPEPFRRIATESDLMAAEEETQIELTQFPLVVNKDASSAQSFLSFHRWMDYIDRTLNSKEEK